MKYLDRKFLLLVLMIPVVQLMAQKPSPSSNDTLAATVAKLSKSFQALERIKITGYIQAQYQKADTLGVKTFDGGDFAASSSQRFMVRRGYLKVAYTGNIATYVVQMNVNERGFSIRDAYVSLREPWLNAFSLTGGIFYRPFGYELSYSTPMRESPEIGRVTQLLFPGERELGAAITFQMPEKSTFHPLKIEAGLFSGNGPTPETDDRLDFIGRIGYADAIKKSKISYGLGFSYYNGSVYQATNEVFEMHDFNGIQAFSQRKADTIPGNYFKRRYLGIDAQFSIQTLLGLTTLRGDFIAGDQPGSQSSSSSPTAAINYSLFLRKFSGGSFYFVQAIPGNIFSAVLKYDFYDPNTQISGNEIGKKVTSAKATNGTDIAYTTWGFGGIADITPKLRLMLYYDLVKNETSTNLSGFNADQKDNIFTARIQFRF